jgi:hypothetical protein
VVTLALEDAMDAPVFDRLTRRFAAASSRRTLGGAVLGSLAGLLAGSGPEAVEAHDGTRKHNRLVHCNGRCKGCEVCERGSCVNHR